MQHDPIFGGDTKIFVLEQWMALENEKYKSTSMELIFRCGKYGGLGRVVAYVELDKGFFEVHSRPRLIDGYLHIV